MGLKACCKMVLMGCLKCEVVFSWADGRVVFENLLKLQLRLFFERNTVEVFKNM